MIVKQCAGCGNYFTGEFDGDYSCANCRRDGVVRARPLEPLEPLAAGVVSPARASQPAAPEALRPGAHGQAA